MTVANETRSQTIPGSNSTGPFTADFRVLSAADLAVYVVDSDGVRDDLVLDTDYTVTLVNGGADGVSITTTVAVATGDTLVIEGSATISQPTDYANQGRFYPETHETSYDRLTIIAQELSALLGRGIVIPVVDGALTVELPTAANRANKAIVFDADGNVDVSTVDVAGLAAAVAAAELAETNAETAETNAETAETNAETAAAAAAASAVESASYSTGGKIYLANSYI